MSMDFSDPPETAISSPFGRGHFGFSFPMRSNENMCLPWPIDPFDPLTN